MRFTLLPPKTVFMKRHCFPASLVSVSAMIVSMCQKNIVQVSIQEPLPPLPPLPPMLQCYMLHVTLRKINFGHFRAQRIVYINNKLFIYTIL